jgi:glutathione peroxidase
MKRRTGVGSQQTNDDQGCKPGHFSSAAIIATIVISLAVGCAGWTPAQDSSGVGLNPESQQLPTTAEPPAESETEESDEESLNSKQRKNKMTESIYDFKAKSLDGKDIDLSSYKGDVLLIVNTASQCGFTKQYQGLEEIYEKFKDRGFKVLGFPCNQFGNQEPGDSGEIASFCQKNFGVNFQMFEKVDVNGDDAHPLYKYLTKAAPGALGTKGIKWNFTKFLIDRQGNVLKRYSPQTKPEDLVPEVEKLL